MPLAGFEPTISVFKRAKTFHALERAATVTGHYIICCEIMCFDNFYKSTAEGTDRLNIHMQWNYTYEEW
jgi:hypothetical protein